MIMNNKDRQKKAAAIHDISCIGRCSLTVALPILSALGVNTGVIPTAVLSTHTGEFEDFTYKDLTSEISAITRHWNSLNLNFDAIYSGFLGSYDQIDLVDEIFGTFKTEDTLILVDPVMGDNGKLYATYTDEMARGMGKLCRNASIITPNVTEAAVLLNEDYSPGPYTEAYVESLLIRLSEEYAEKVVLTGIFFNEKSLGTAAYDSKTKKMFYSFTPKIERIFHGAGDVFGSALLGVLLNGFTFEEAVSIAVDFVYECIRQTLKEGLELKYGLCFEKVLPYLISKCQRKTETFA